MGKFLNGLFVGIGIGLFIAPQKGEETRRLIMESIAAWRKGASSEDDQHFLINARPAQITTFPVQPAGPIAVYSSEPEEQVTANIPAAEPIAVPSSEPEEQISTMPVAEPIAMSSSEPEEQISTSMPVAYSSSTPGNQIANVTDDDSHSADTAQASGLATEPHFVSDANSDQGTPAETPKADTEDRTKLSTLSSASNRPSQTARRKASARTPNTGKTRGHNRS